MARFATLYSGSSGNSAAVVRSGPEGEEYLLVDVGKNCKQTLLALQELGLPVSGLRGILITHEHADHVNGLNVFLKKCPVPVYGSTGTLRALTAQQLVPPTARLLPLEEETVLSGFTVRPFAASHDAADYRGYRITVTDAGHEAVMGIATDIGTVDGAVFQCLRGCGLVALEANYDRVRLQLGPYPYYLKRRIASDTGHLSNDACAEVVAELAAEGCRRFALCHLSQENNTPELARVTVQRRAEQSLTPLEAASLLLQVSPRHQPSPWVEF